MKKSLLEFAFCCLVATPIALGVAWALGCDLRTMLPKPTQAQSASIRARVAPVKIAVRQLKSGKWRLTLETQDASVGRLQQGQAVEVRVR